MPKIYIGRTFANTIVELDETRFEDCAFHHCNLIYRGGPIYGFVDCSFRECQWTFDGAADNTLIFLSTVYLGFGPDGRELVEAVFNTVRDGTVGSHVESIHHATRAVAS